MLQIFWFFVFVMLNSFIYMNFFAREDARISRINNNYPMEFGLSAEFVISFHSFMVSFFIVSAMILFFIAYGLVNIKFPPNFFM